MGCARPRCRRARQAPRTEAAWPSAREPRRTGIGALGWPNRKSFSRTYLKAFVIDATERHIVPEICVFTGARAIQVPLTRQTATDPVAVVDRARRWRGQHVRMRRPRICAMASMPLPLKLLTWLG